MPDTNDDDDLSFPQQFMDESIELAARTDDGKAWAKFMYGDWFVCPTSRLLEILEISISRRRDYVAHGTDDSGRIDIVVDTPTLGDSSCKYGFELPHISLRDIILESVRFFQEPDGSIKAIDKADAIKLIDDVESCVLSAITELRAKIK
jgi:hypothetical protein